MDIAALGRTRWLFDAVTRAAAAGHRVRLIATAPAPPEYGVGEADFRALADRLGAAFLDGGRLHDPHAAALLEQAGAAAAISVNWPVLIGPAVRARFPLGIINAHVGDLPRYRGNACPNWAILNGESQAVLTFHRMGDGIDDGDVLRRAPLPIGPDTYIADIYRRLDDAIPQGFVDVLNGLERGEIRPEPQSADPADSLRCYPRRPADGLIDWSRPAAEIARLVRASAEPFSGAFTYLDDRRVTVWRATNRPFPGPILGVPGQVAAIDRKTGEVAVVTGDGCLALREIEAAPEGRMPAARLIQTIHTRLGLDPAALIERLERRVAALERAAANRSGL